MRIGQLAHVDRDERFTVLAGQFGSLRRVGTLHVGKQRLGFQHEFAGPVIGEPVRVRFRRRDAVIPDADPLLEAAVQPLALSLSGGLNLPFGRTYALVLFVECLLHRRVVQPETVGDLTLRHSFASKPYRLSNPGRMRDGRLVERRVRRGHDDFGGESVGGV